MPNIVRGTSEFFREDWLKKWMEQEGLDLIVRAHRLFDEGYRFHADNQLLTIFGCGIRDGLSIAFQSAEVHERE